MNSSPQPDPPDLRTATFLLLLTTAFLNAAGIGLITPSLPFLAERFASSPERVATIVGWLSASYSICAFLAAPVLGAWSDIVGRRPVLVLSIAGSAVGYALFGVAGALPLLFLGRIIDGLTAGNFATLLAYLGDATSEKSRSRYFGKVAAVSGAGFIVGPAIGGIAQKLLGLEGPFLVAAAITAVDVAWALFFLPESLPPERRLRGVPWQKLNPFSQLAGLFELPRIRSLLLVRILFAIAFGCLMPTFALLAKDRLGWGADKVSFVLVMVGATDIVMQGMLLGILDKALGSGRVLALGMGLTLVSFAGFGLVAMHPSAALFITCIGLFAGGEGLFSATFSGLLSQTAGPGAQGRVQGGDQALQGLTFAVVPILSTQLYAQAGPGAPYWVAMVINAIGAAILGLANLRAGQQVAS